MYNFCERITMHVVIHQDAGKKWKYQANYTMGIHICRTYFRNTTGPPTDPEIDILVYILPIRLNRADRRKVVSKKAVFFQYRVA